MAAFTVGAASQDPSAVFEALRRLAALDGVKLTGWVRGMSSTVDALDLDLWLGNDPAERPRTAVQLQDGSHAAVMVWLRSTLLCLGVASRYPVAAEVAEVLSSEPGAHVATELAPRCTVPGYRPE